MFSNISFRAGKSKEKSPFPDILSGSSTFCSLQRAQRPRNDSVTQTSLASLSARLRTTQISCSFAMSVSIAHGSYFTAHTQRRCCNATCLQLGLLRCSMPMGSEQKNMATKSKYFRDICVLNNNFNINMDRTHSACPSTS